MFERREILTFIYVGIFELFLYMPTVEAENHNHQQIEAKANEGYRSPSREIFIALLFFASFYIGMLISKTCLLVVMPYPIDYWSSNNGTNDHGSIKHTESLWSRILKAEPLDSQHQNWVNDTYSKG